jgi:hypothetical protein
VSAWLVVAPERADDAALSSSAWIARATIRRAPVAPATLTGTDAVRAIFEQHVAGTPGLTGVAFFGHGAEDRLFDADRVPQADGPGLLDSGNVALLRGCWVHAFACWSGKTLAAHAIEQGIAIYVGYRRPLDVGWSSPPSAEREFVELVTCTTLALLAGERDERTLRAKASRAADDFVEALEALPDAQKSQGWLWLHALAQQLVDNLVVACP